jgi:hypothetical protein
MSELELPFIASIPYSVQIDDSIPDAVKIYFGQIVGLSRKYGYIFATDEALAEMKNTSPKNIERWNKILEDAGHIRRETRNEHIKDENGKYFWKKKRKIYVTEGFSRKKEPKEEDSNNFSEPLKNEGIIEPLKNEGIIEPLKNEGYNNTLLNKHLEQQQAVGVFFDCLKDIDILGHEKAWLSKHYDEKTIKQAIEYASKVEIKTTLIQTLKWACEKKPEIPLSKEENTQKNKELALKVQADAVVPEGTHFEVLNKAIEICFGGNAAPFVLEYSEVGFIDKFKEALKKYRITPK